MIKPAPGKYQCADCGKWSEEPFTAVYKHWAVDIYLLRCPPCAERWDTEVEPVLDQYNGNGRTGRWKGKGRRRQAARQDG